MNSEPASGDPRSGVRIPTRRKGREGFSLIEVLVALSIMALVLTVLFQVFSTGLRTAGMAEQYNVAERLAQSVLEEAAASRPFEVGERSGEFDGTRYRWRTWIEPDRELGESFDLERFQAYRITARILWEGRGGEREFSLSTLRLQEGTR